MEDTIKRLMEKLPEIEDKELVELIKELLQERKYLSEIAYIDTSTGLNNRRIIGNIRDCSIFVVFDVDHFKSVNDTYGHDVGDEILKNIAQITKNNVRFNDYLYRFGGDEFCIAFTNVNKEVVKERLHLIQNSIKENVHVPDPNHKITISVGMVENTKNEKIDDLMKKADLALYEAKNNGRNRISEYKEIEKILK